MTVTTLPSSPTPERMTWAPQDFGSSLRGPLGGSTQRVNRLGNRWALTVEMGPMTSDDGRDWSAALSSGLRNGVLFAFLQPGLTIGSPGTPLVNGASQVGSSLIADGFSADYAMVAGQFFSVSISSQRYVYQLSADVTASGAGAATLAISPPLRLSPGDGDTLEFATPYIEGLLTGVPSWFMQSDRLARGFSFTIEEAR